MDIYSAGGADSGEGHINIFPLSYVSIGQGTWNVVLSANMCFQARLRNTTVADGDNISYQVYLDAGTYTMLVLSHTWGSGGINDFDIDGSEVASFDMYAASAIFNVRNLQTGIAIATAGLKTLRVRIDGKNASSAAYSCGVISITLWRTA